MDSHHRYIDMPRYLRHSTANNLRELRGMAQCHKVSDWRELRKCGLHNWHLYVGAFAQAGNGTWYTHRGAQFRNERPAHEVAKLPYTGWFGDTEHQEKLYRGIVASLPHGRFIAGYESDDNGERVYFSGVYDDEREAAHIADEHARIVAEQEDEYSQRWNEAMKLDGIVEDKRADVEKSFALRNHPKLGQREREWTREVIADIRAFERERAALNVD